jgi:hypothetical protein
LGRLAGEAGEAEGLNPAGVGGDEVYRRERRKRRDGGFLGSGVGGRGSVVGG